MCRVGVSAILAAVSILALAGCQSHQAKVDALQKQYDQLAGQFSKDCSAEYLKIPPSISPKCTDENKKVKEAWDQLNAERARNSNSKEQKMNMQNLRRGDRSSPRAHR